MCLDPRLVAECRGSAASVPVGRRGRPVVASVCLCAAAEQKGGVHNVHTLGFGLGRTAVGSGRFPYVPGEPSVGRGWNAVRVPLGQSMTPRQSGFCFNVCTLTLRGSL